LSVLSFKKYIMKRVNQRERVRLDEIGLYLRTIQLDYKPEDNQEMADLITQHFNVLCLVEDVEHYLELEHDLNIINEDYELEDRRAKYFSELGLRNPFM
jgi:hypothetical protein